jgi:hypothetical protein
MKLFVGLANGATLAVEGTYEEITRYGDKLVREFGPDIINLEEAQKLGGPTVHVKAPSILRWTEHSVKKLLGLLYGEQEKLLKFIVEHGGTATYAEIGKHMGYNGQHLSGILSPITRNAQSATNDDSARVIDWRPSEHPGQRIYFVDSEALPLLKKALNKSA